MIVASLLLIPVAVLFLALGLVNGSSSLLITSIATSLLAAVALVIGTRQAAARGAAKTSEAAFVHGGRPPRRAGHDPDIGDPAVHAPAFAENSAPAPMPSAGESVHYGEPAERPSADEVDEARAAGAQDTATRLGDRGEPSVPVGADYADSDSKDDSASRPARLSVDDGSEERAWRPGAAAAENLEQTDEFADPDDDDPDDEPLPQSVRPADAVLVARFDTEVLVVDGRPRYHMADCPHLVGRLTEPLPANEAVELGFSPCGLCRPVDRLVAAVAQQR